MDVSTLLLLFLALGAGALAGFLFGAALGRARSAAAAGARELAAADIERLRAERDELADRLAGAGAETARLTAAVEHERARSTEKLAVLEASAAALSSEFKALSAQALAANSEQFLLLADARLREAGARAAGDLEARRLAVEHMVAPLQETLAKVECQLSAAESARASSSAALTREVELVRASSEQLRLETASLVTALRKPQTRGQWGEMQLRRVVEVAGMLAHCDFDAQASSSSDGDGVLRPDMVVRLAGGKNVVVDAKVPLVAFLEAAETADDSVRAERLKAHARHLRTHVDLLSAKSYWERHSPSPEFVVLFVPGEAFLAPALDADPSLQEYAAGKGVILATPTILIGLLRTVAYAWTQAALADNAKEVFEVGRDLYSRLCTLGDHVDKLGRSINAAVGDYNKVVGALETRVLVQARRLSDLKVVEKPLERPRILEVAARAITAAELLSSDDTPTALVVLPRSGPPAEETAMSG
jgi:DNA recombination protein RmuC